MFRFNLFFLCYLFVASAVQLSDEHHDNICTNKHPNAWVKLTHDQTLTIHRTIRHVSHTFTLALKQNRDGINILRQYILNSSSNPTSEAYGSYLSIDQINRLIGTPKTHIDIVLSWLHLPTMCSSYADAIKCVVPKCKMPHVESLFQIKLDAYYHCGMRKLVHRSDIPYTIHYSIRQYVDFVDGISNPLPEVSVRKIGQVSTDSGADPGGFGLEVFNRLYESDTELTGPSVSLGVIEYSGKSGFSNKDLHYSQQGNGVPDNLVSPEHLIGNNNRYPDTESELDIQVVYWGSTKATLWYEEFDGWIYSWAVDFANRESVPEVVSISWGWAETHQCDIVPCNNQTSQQYVERCNVELMKLAGRGITVLVSSGDAGSPGRTNEDCESVNGPDGWNHINAAFPGSSPWVTSVGATYLRQQDTPIKTHYTSPVCTKYASQHITCSNSTAEAGVYFNATQWTTGGGFTRWDSTPDWQQDHVTKYFTSGVPLPGSQYFNIHGRGYPDVSAVGHNCLVYLKEAFSKGWNYVDGTSCSSPVFAGVIAQLNSYQKSKKRPVIGFANPLLYRMSTLNKFAFRDITIGTTQCTEFQCCSQQFGFQATSGWDPVSGLGTPNIKNMIQTLDRLDTERYQRYVTPN